MFDDLPIQQVINTLHYCLETFELACQCGNCDPCTHGQAKIREAIETAKKVAGVTA